MKVKFSNVTVDLSPMELCNMICTPEHLLSFGTDELVKMIEYMKIELNVREGESGHVK